MKILKNIFKIDDDLPLQENRSFWRAIYLPIIVAVLFSIPILFEPMLRWDWSSDGYEEFVRHFKFPLSIASLSIVFGVMVARFHRSAQAKRSVDEVIKQNNFRNYYDHREYFIRYITDKYPENDFNSSVLYKHIFYSNNPTQVETKVTEGFITILESEIDRTLAEIVELSTSCTVKSEFVRGMHSIFWDMFEYLGLRNKYPLAVTSTFDENEGFLLLIVRAYFYGAAFGTGIISTDTTARAYDFTMTEYQFDIDVKKKLKEFYSQATDTLGFKF